MIEPGDMHYYQPMWTLVSTDYTFISNSFLFLTIILCGFWSLPTITLPLYLKLLAPICQPPYMLPIIYFTKLCGPWSVFTVTVHVFLDKLTATPAGWRRSQKPGSIRPAHGELPSQVGVLEYINIIQGVFLTGPPL